MRYQSYESLFSELRYPGFDQYRREADTAIEAIRALPPIPDRVSSVTEALTALWAAKEAMRQVDLLEPSIRHWLEVLEELPRFVLPTYLKEDVAKAQEVTQYLLEARRMAIDVINAAIGVAATVVTPALVRRMVQRGELRITMFPGRSMELFTLLNEATGSTEEAQAVIRVCSTVFRLVWGAGDHNWPNVVYLPDQRLYELDGRVYRVGKLLNRMRESSREVRFEPLAAFMEAVTEVAPVSAEGIEVSLYVGAASGAAYRKATDDGVNSCMARPVGQMAVMSSNEGLDDVNGVLLFSLDGHAVARCKVTYVVCLRCGHTFVYQDRLYVADTRLTTVVWEVLTRLDACRFKEVCCPACGYGQAAKVLRGPILPYEDSFDRKAAREAHGLLVLPLSESGWREKNLKPEDVVARLVGRVKLADAVCRQLDGVRVVRSGDVPDVLRAIRDDAKRDDIRGSNVLLVGDLAADNKEGS